MRDGVFENCSVSIIYVIESAAYGLLFTSCLCQKPELVVMMRGYFKEDT